MSAHTLSQTPTPVRQIIVRYRWAIALTLLSVVTALVAYRFSSVPVVATPIVSGSQVSLVDQQGVLDYLRVHGTVVETRHLDPAQQSVMSYLRAHESVVQSPAPWDPAVQAVLDYLQVHGR